MADIKDQLIKDSYNYVLQSDISTGVVYRIGGSIPVNPIFSSGLTINSGFTYSNGTEQPGYALLTDGSGYAYWGPVSGTSPSSGVTTNYYGSFSDTTTQPVSAADTPTAWSANTTELSNGIYIQNGSKITVSNDGIYEIGYSAQIEKTQGGGDAVVTIWAEINGNAVDRSSSTLTLPNQSAYQLPFVSYIFELYAGDTVEFYFSSTLPGTQITTLSGLTSPTRPVSPSLIIVAKAIGSAVLNTSGDSYVTGFTLTNSNLTLSQNRVGQYSGFTVNLPYLPLSGGTLTGALTGTTYYGDGSNLTGISTGGGGGAGGQVYYFNISNTQNDYYEFSTSAVTASEQSLTVSTGSTQTAYIGGFLSPSSLPNVTSIPSGIFSFYIHSYTSNSTATFDLYCELYKRTTGGAETLLFTSDPTTVAGTSTIMYTTDGYFSGATLNSSDRILVKIYATNTSNQARSITILSQGSQHYSYSITTIPSYVDTYVTGFTYSNNTFTIKQNNNQTDLTRTFDTVTGWTINGNLLVTGNTSLNLLTATTITANTVTIKSSNSGATPTIYTPFTDDYNRVTLSPGGTPSLTYTNTNTGAGNATIVTNYLNIANGAVAGQSYTTIPLSGFGSPFNPTLASNSATTTIEWSFNLRTNRGSIFSGFLAGAYGGAVVLASTTTNLQSAGNGYALVYGGSATRNWRLVRYTGGLSGTITDIVSGGIFASNTSYVSARIVYAPATNTWTYYFRDDGLAAWGDPTTVTTLIGSAVDSTYTSSLMSVFGVFFNYSTAANQNLQFDNLRVQQTDTPVTPAVDILTLKNYSNTTVFNVKDDGTTSISGSVSTSSSFLGTFSGTSLGNGSALTLGQFGTMITGTTALSVTSTTTALTLIPGLTTTITVPTQTMVYIQTNGGVNTTATTSTGGSALDVAILVDGAVLAAGGYQRIYADNPTANATVTNWVANWNTSVILTLSAGSHTVQVSAVYVAGSTATVSGGAGAIKQGTLTIMILKNT